MSCYLVLLGAESGKLFTPAGRESFGFCPFFFFVWRSSQLANSPVRWKRMGEMTKRSAIYTCCRNRLQHNLHMGLDGALQQRHQVTL